MQPIICHIYLGNRLLASITGSGQVCFVATAAFGSPLAAELDVFRDLRDRILLRLSPGRAFVNWYYHGFGPSGAAFIGNHPAARAATRLALSLTVPPLKFILYRPGWFVLIVFGASALLVAATFLSRDKKHRRSGDISVAGRYSLSFRPFALFAAIILAFVSLSVYYVLMEPGQAAAASNATASGTYYYTLDHIGRPFNLRDSTRTLRWYEHHYAFGDSIEEETVNGLMYAGSGAYAITWKPGARFPGQYEEVDMYPFVQNHYREYLPEYGGYNRMDPIKNEPYFLKTSKRISYPYGYSRQNPLRISDRYGLYDIAEWNCIKLTLHPSIGLGIATLGGAVGVFHGDNDWYIGFDVNVLWAEGAGGWSPKGGQFSGFGISSQCSTTAPLVGIYLVGLELDLTCAVTLPIPDGSCGVPISWPRPDKPIQSCPEDDEQQCPLDENPSGD